MQCGLAETNGPLRTLRLYDYACSTRVLVWQTSIHVREAGNHLLLELVSKSTIVREIGFFVLFVLKISLFHTQLID